jgi:hypothetical protein
VTTFEARYHGHCPACDDHIHAGDAVTYDDDEVVHVTCATEFRQRVPDLMFAPCPMCHLSHAGECP